MALILGALIIQGITPGPQLISEHPDIFWGLVASLDRQHPAGVLNVPMIGVWVKLLSITLQISLSQRALLHLHRCVQREQRPVRGVATLAIGLAGYVLLQLGYHPAPIMLGFRAGAAVRGELPPGHAALARQPDDLVERPISATFLLLAVILVGAQVYFRFRKNGKPLLPPSPQPVGEMLE